MNSLKKALVFAAKAHEGQYRKNNGGDIEPVPYILHPVAVAFAAAQHGLPIEVQQAALLHDVLKDTEATVEELQAEFGSYVAGLVVELTNPSHSEEHQNKMRAERKRIDREHLAKVSRYAKMLKILERTDNLQDINGYTPKLLRLYLDESKELFKVLEEAHWRIANDLMEAIIEVEGKLSA
jgi:guanosine-3',5'-bis(diphosphate) 3'-pyrophosphohydrolase